MRSPPFVSVCTHENFSFSPLPHVKVRNLARILFSTEKRNFNLSLYLTLWVKNHTMHSNVSHDTYIVLLFNRQFLTIGEICWDRGNEGCRSMSSHFYLSRLSQQVKNRLGASDTECVFSYTKSTISIHSTSITLLFVIHKHYGKYKPQRSTHSLSCTQKVK